MTLQRRSRRSTATEHRLEELDLFARCTRRDLATISAWTTEVAVRAGAVLSRERVTAPQFVIVLDGRVELSCAGRTAGAVTDGGWFGHRGLIDNRPLADVTAIARASTRVLVFSRREFNSLLHLAPAIAAVLDCQTNRRELVPTAHRRARRHRAAPLLPPAAGSHAPVAGAASSPSDRVEQVRHEGVV